MQKIEMEKQKISYEILCKSYVCFGEIGISTENQVSNITEKRENERENCLERGGDFFPKGGCPKGGREGGKPLIPRGKAQKKA